MAIELSSSSETTNVDRSINIFKVIQRLELGVLEVFFIAYINKIQIKSRDLSSSTQIEEFSVPEIMGFRSVRCLLDYLNDFLSLSLLVCVLCKRSFAK